MTHVKSIGGGGGY